MSAFTAYIVTYDICDPKRLRAVYKTMRGFGEHWQYSVFHCELTLARKVRLLSALEDIIDHREDQILIAPLGPVGGQNQEAIEVMGKRRPRTPRGPKIV